ncbi:MAG: LysR family transcriptional regulator [Proteobacteria bacterium]|nr:LysR family transcriptional regulator [Pseudomonadota bacterium]MBS0572977.1 LysR family transcriptional regulator [Pseudomonadota bacterium]
MPLRITLRQLEYFVAVGEAGSIVTASEKVNVSSPSISSAISQLEAEFGLQLFVRKHAQGLALTQAGRQLMAQARQVLGQAEQLARLADEISGNVQGPLGVGCLLTFAQIMVPQLRRSFEQLHPKVRVSQYELDQTEIYARLRNGEIDLALTYDLEIPPDLTFIPLAELSPYVMVGETHPLAHLPSASVEELKDHPMVLLDLPLSSDYFLSFFSRRGLKPLIAERTKDISVVRGLVANGYGYSIANIRPVNDRAPDGRPLRFIPLVGEVRPMIMGLVLVEGAESVLAVRAFVDHCRAAITRTSIPGMDLSIAGPRRDF